MSDTYIVTATDGRFWSGWNWTNEYPDAWKFKTLMQAVKLAESLESVANVVENYGFEAERTVHTTEK